MDKNFKYDHLPAALQEVSKLFADVLEALEANESVVHGEQFYYGKQRLLEAKDCFVRARLEGM